MLLYKSRVFDLYSTNVSSRHTPFEYVGHQGSCAALVVSDDNQIGLLAHHRPAIGRTLFELPAGTVDHNRTLEEIIISELDKEAALVIDEKQLHRLSSWYTSPGYTTELLTLFLVRVTQEQCENNETLRWFSLRELNTLIQNGELVDMKTVASVTAYQSILWKDKNDEVL